ncbi:MAG: hypothetical protein OXQ29_19665 [Rhodospirillaceae bacterium]|nr:hypothetical protein [Rhodospirillaceae bacterium]
MPEPLPADERTVYNQVQKIIGDLIALDKDSRIRIYRTVGAFFGFEDARPSTTPSGAVPTSRPATSRDPHFSAPSPPPLKDFLFEKKPTTDVDRVACLAYYLTHHRDAPHFRTTEISKLNTEAAQVKFSNPSAAVNNAVRAGLLTAATRGTKQLTAHGERYVEALPDRAAATQLLSRARPRRSRKKPAGNGSVNSTNQKRDD